MPQASRSNAGDLFGRLQRLLATCCLAEVPQRHRVCWLVFDTGPTTLVLGLPASEHGVDRGGGVLQVEVKHPGPDSRSDA